MIHSLIWRRTEYVFGRVKSMPVHRLVLISILGALKASFGISASGRDEEKGDKLEDKEEKERQRE